MTCYGYPPELLPLSSMYDVMPGAAILVVTRKCRPVAAFWVVALG